MYNKVCAFHRPIDQRPVANVAGDLANLVALGIREVFDIKRDYIVVFG